MILSHYVIQMVPWLRVQRDREGGRLHSKWGGQRKVGGEAVARRVRQSIAALE